MFRQVIQMMIDDPVRNALQTWSEDNWLEEEDLNILWDHLALRFLGQSFLLITNKDDKRFIFDILHTHPVVTSDSLTSPFLKVNEVSHELALVLGSIGVYVLKEEASFNDVSTKIVKEVIQNYFFECETLEKKRLLREDMSQAVTTERSEREPVFLTHDQEGKGQMKDIREFISENIWGIKKWVRDVKECQPLCKNSEKKQKKSQSSKEKRTRSIDAGIQNSFEKEGNNQSQGQERFLYICHEEGFLIDYPSELVQNLRSQIELMGDFANVRKTLEDILGVYDLSIIKELQPFMRVMKKMRMGMVHQSSEELVTILLSGEMTVNFTWLHSTSPNFTEKLTSCSWIFSYF